MSDVEEVNECDLASETPRSILKQSSESGPNGTTSTKKSVTIMASPDSEEEVPAQRLWEGFSSLNQIPGQQLEMAEPSQVIDALTGLTASEAHRQQVQDKLARSLRRRSKHSHRRQHLQEAQPSRSTKLPESPELSDGKGIKWEYWLFMIKLNLKGNADLFPEPMHRIGYVVSRCKGKALDHLIPRIREGCPNPYEDYENIIDHLREVFEDPTRQLKARAEYDQLHMASTDDFGDFLIEFHRLAQEAEIPKEDWTSELFTKLSLELLPLSLRDGITTEAWKDIEFVEFSRLCRNFFTITKLYPE